jgi:hypothetical protein
MNAPGFWIRLVFFSCCLFAPPLLAVFALIRAWRGPGGTGRRLSLSIGIVVIVNWVVLCYYLRTFDDIQISEAALLAYRLSTLLLPLSLICLVATVWTRANRGNLILANFVLATLWMMFGYAPQHWLTRVER